MREPRDAGSLLRSCLAADGRELADEQLLAISPREWAAVPTAARYHRVGAAAYVALRHSTVVPRDVLSALAATHGAAVRRHLLVWQTLVELGPQLERAGIEHAFFKGPVLAETVYARPDLREYSDLDVLVRPASFEAAVDLLGGLGAQLFEANWELILHTLRGELNFVAPRGVAVDLHWSLLHDDEIRRQFCWHSNELLDRRVVGQIGGHRVPMLDPHDQLLHLCVHACLDGCHRLHLLQDVRLAATRLEVSWEELWGRANRAGIAGLVAVTLDRVNRCFGTALPVPDDHPPEQAWRMSARAVDAVRPPWDWHGGALTGHLVFASTRSSASASVRAFGDSLGGAVAELAREPTHPWRRGRAAPPRPREMLEPVGDPHFRRAYFTAVAATQST